MKPGRGPVVALLAILGVIDLLQVPFMVAAQQHAGEPPTVVIIVIAIVGLAHRPSTALFYASAVILVLSIAAIGLLARLSLGRRSQPSAAQAQP